MHGKIGVPCGAVSSEGSATKSVLPALICCMSALPVAYRQALLLRRQLFQGVGGCEGDNLLFVVLRPFSPAYLSKVSVCIICCRLHLVKFLRAVTDYLA